MKKQINRKKSFKPNWRRIAIAVTVAFFFVLGVYTAAVSAYDAAVDGVEYAQKVVEDAFPEPKPLVVDYDYHKQVVVPYDGYLVGFIMQQGFSYREALALADEVRTDNGLSGSEVARGTVLWLPARSDW